MSKVVVIGSGTMGVGIAAGFLAYGTDTIILGRTQEKAEKCLEAIQACANSINPTWQTLGASLLAGSIPDWNDWQDTALVIETISERLDLKKEIFADLDRLAPAGTILATNTSSISITEIAAQTKRPEQVIGMHFMNPVPVMQLVEIIRGLATSDATTARVVELSKAVGKTPVEVNDYPGFVANRILMPMINEAVFCVMEGVGTPEAVDTVMKLGMNHPMGPLALADLIGLDTCVAILDVLHTGLGDPKYRACPLLRKYVAAGWLGRKSGRGFYTYA